MSGFRIQIETDSGAILGIDWCVQCDQGGMPESSTSYCLEQLGQDIIDAIEDYSMSDAAKDKRDDDATRLLGKLKEAGLISCDSDVARLAHTVDALARWVEGD